MHHRDLQASPALRCCWGQQQAGRRVASGDTRSGTPTHHNDMPVSDRGDHSRGSNQFPGASPPCAPARPEEWLGKKTCGVRGARKRQTEPHSGEPARSSPCSNRLSDSGHSSPWVQGLAALTEQKLRSCLLGKHTVLNRARILIHSFQMLSKTCRGTLQTSPGSAPHSQFPPEFHSLCARWQPAPGTALRVPASWCHMVCLPPGHTGADVRSHNTGQTWRRFCRIQQKTRKATVRAEGPQPAPPASCGVFSFRLSPPASLKGDKYPLQLQRQTC